MTEQRRIPDYGYLLEHLERRYGKEEGKVRWDLFREVLEVRLTSAAHRLNAQLRGSCNHGRPNTLVPECKEAADILYRYVMSGEDDW
jgi:hypothetical protein